MFDSGYPITIFTQKNLCRLLKTDLVLARRLPENEEVVDYNERPLILLGYISVDVEMDRQKMRGARIMISRDGKRSLIGRNGLTEAQNECE